MDDDGVRQLLRHHWAEVAGGGGRLDAAGIHAILLRMGYQAIDMAATLRGLGLAEGEEASEELFTRWFFRDGASGDASASKPLFYRSRQGSQVETTVGQLPLLLADGDVTEATIVWADGLREWQPLARARGEESLGAALSAALLGAAPEVKQRMLHASWLHLGGAAPGTSNPEDIELGAEEVADVLAMLGYRRDALSSDVQGALGLGDGGRVALADFAAWFTQLSSQISVRDAVALPRCESADEIEALFQAMDIDRDGQLSFAEFRDACSMTIDDTELVRRAFGQLTGSPDGCEEDGVGIGLAEFREGFRVLKEQLAAQRGKERALAEEAARLQVKLEDETVELGEAREEAEMLAAGLAVAERNAARLRESAQDKTALSDELAAAREEVEMLGRGLKTVAASSGRMESLLRSESEALEDAGEGLEAELAAAREEIQALSEELEAERERRRTAEAGMAEAQQEVAALQQAVAELSQGKASSAGGGDADGRCEPPTVVDAPPVRSRSRSPSPVAEGDS